MTRKSRVTCPSIHPQVHERRRKSDLVWLWLGVTVVVVQFYQSLEGLGDKVLLWFRCDLLPQGVCDGSLVFSVLMCHSVEPLRGGDFWKVTRSMKPVSSEEINCSHGISCVSLASRFPMWSLPHAYDTVMPSVMGIPMLELSMPLNFPSNELDKAL